MATIEKSVTGMPNGVSGPVVIVTWANLKAGDDGRAADLRDWADRSVQVEGTFSGATVNIEGTIDGNNWIVLTDPQGNPLSFTDRGLEAITELVAAIRPKVTGGTGSTDLTVSMIVRGQR